MSGAVREAVAQLAAIVTGNTVNTAVLCAHFLRWHLIACSCPIALWPRLLCVCLSTIYSRRYIITSHCRPLLAITDFEHDTALCIIRQYLHSYPLNFWLQSLR